MGIDLEFDTTVDELIKTLQKLKKEHGGRTKVTLPSPGFYDPYLDGHNCKLTAVFGKNYIGQDRVLIVEKTRI